MRHLLSKPRNYATTIVAIVMIVSVTTFFYPSKARAFFLPFGGAIISIFAGCINGYIVTVGPPGGGLFMWVPGTFSYVSGPPSHPSQLLLGVFGPPTTCYVPCTFGICPYGIFETIIFHGSSI